MTDLAVLLTVDFAGGVSRYVYELCRALPDVRFTLASMGPHPTPQERERFGRLANVQLNESDFPLEWQGSEWWRLDEAGNWLLRLADASGVQLIHLNGYVHACLPFHRPVLVVAHSCVSTWWQAVHRTPPPSEWSEYRRRVQDGLQAADLVAAPTTSMRSALLRSYDGVGECIVLPNGVADIARRIGKNPHILCAGRVWDEAKNIRQVVRCAPRLRWPVRVAGPGAIEGVQHLGALSWADMAQEYDQAAIYLHPARYEPFGLAVLEAAQARCALVLGDIPSLRENWDGAALFVDPDDDEALVNAVNSLIAEPHVRVALGSAARLRAEGFSASSMARSYRRTYHRLLADRRSLACAS